MFKRVIIKLSGEAIGGNNEFGFDNHIINNILTDIIDIINKGVEVSIVIGGGNFWRGRDSDSKINRSKSDQIGMLATIMNGIYISDRLTQLGIYSKVMTPFIVSNFTKEFSLDSALDILYQKGICIFSGGIGHPFFSTDTIAALRAAELGCDAILYGKNIDGIYDKDPKKDSSAIKYKEITYDEIIKKDLQAIDISAMNIAKNAKITSVVFALAEKNSLEIAVRDDCEIFNIGTKVNY